HYIAVHDDVGAVSAKRIAEEFGIPPELLAKILQRLAKRRLIMSQSGPKGGYALSRHPSKITVGEVIRALEGPISIVSCLDHGGCPQEPRCNLRRPVQKLQVAITQMLEAINLALKGVAEMYREKGNHIVTTAIEQRAGLDTCKRLERQGLAVTYVPVQTNGLVDVDEVRKAITDKTILISVMFANNEIGTIQDIAAIGKLAKE